VRTWSGSDCWEGKGHRILLNLNQKITSLYLSRRSLWGSMIRSERAYSESLWNAANVANDWNGCRTSESNDRNGCQTSEMNDWSGCQISEMRRKISPNLCGL